MEVSIDSFRREDAAKRVVASFNACVKHGEFEITINRVKLIESSKGTRFIGWPKYCEEDEFSRKKFINFVSFPKDLEEFLSINIMNLAEQELNKDCNSNSKTEDF